MQRVLGHARRLRAPSAVAFAALQSHAASQFSSSAPAACAGGEARWVFLGPPGVGKGTYASRIAKALDVPHIAAGDLVRDEIKSGSELGRQVCCVVGRGVRASGGGRRRRVCERAPLSHN